MHTAARPPQGQRIRHWDMAQESMLNVTRGSQHIVHIDNGASLQNSGRNEGREPEKLIRKQYSRQVVALGGGVHRRGLRKLGGLPPDLGDGRMAHTDVKIHLTVPPSMYMLYCCSNHPVCGTSSWQPWSEVKKSEEKSLSRVRFFATPWTVAHQAPRSMGFSRHEYWSGLPFPSPGDLPDSGIEPRSPAL